MTTERFVRGNDRLSRMLADPETRREVDQARAAMARADEDDPDVTGAVDGAPIEALPSARRSDRFGE